MPNTDSKVTVIPIRKNGFSGTNSKAISEQPAAAISTGHRPRVQAIEIDHTWKERHCQLTLRQIQIFTNLLRAVTVRLTKLSEYKHEDVLKQIDSRLSKILSRYPGAEIEEELNKESFRICNIGHVPVTDEGMDFIQDVYDLLENREAELKAECERAKLELEAELKALLAKPLPPGNVYHVEIRYAPRNKRGRYGRYNVWAKNEAAAEEKALVKFHQEFPIVRANNYPFQIRETEIQERGSWRWKSYFQLEGGRCE